jgi:hypothetical protein
MPMKMFTFYLESEMKATLKKIRDRDGISEAEQIRRALTDWFKKQEKRR